MSPFEQTLCAACAYALLHAVLRRYNRGWRTPADAAAANWPRRARLGFALGLCCVVAAVVALRWAVPPFELNALLTMQIVLMAAAGASDLQCYRLPAPLTLSGIALAGVLLWRTSAPGTQIVIALLWSTALIGVHIWITRNRIGWGDHLAVLWLALASPLFGLLAIAVGQSALWLCARLSGWGRRPIPVGGAWLLAGVLVVGCIGMGYAQPAARIPRVARGYIGMGYAQPVARIPPVARVDADTDPRRATLILARTGDLIASIALASTPDARRARARTVAARIDALIVTGALTSDERDTLRALANALRGYDLAAIDALDARRVALHDRRRCAMGACSAQ